MSLKILMSDDKKNYTLQLGIFFVVMVKNKIALEDGLYGVKHQIINISIVFLVSR